MNKDIWQEFDSRLTELVDWLNEEKKKVIMEKGERERRKIADRRRNNTGEIYE